MMNENRCKQRSIFHFMCQSYANKRKLMQNSRKQKIIKIKIKASLICQGPLLQFPVFIMHPLTTRNREENKPKKKQQHGQKVEQTKEKKIDRKGEKPKKKQQHRQKREQTKEKTTTQTERQIKLKSRTT